MPKKLDSRVRQVLARGTVIPAHPLALTAERRLDERRQRALTRYYVAAGAGGLAVGVHTTQFAIRDPRADSLSRYCDWLLKKWIAPMVLARNRSFELVASVAKPRRPFGRRNCYWIWDTAQGC